MARSLSINPYLICAIGAATGFLAGLLMGSTAKIVRIEEILVGIFGAFIGGDFLVSQINGPTAAAAPTHFSGMAFGMAIAGAAVMLVLLKLMRGVVGPMRNSKSRQRQR